jgi:uncharacterized protein
MDVCAFVGVAPRGPAWVPYTDEEWLEAGLDPARLRGALATTSCVDPTRPRRRSVAVPIGGWDEYTRLFGSFEGPGQLPYAIAAFFDQGGRRAYVVRVVHDDAKSDTRTATGAIGGLTTPYALRARNEGSWGSRLHARMTFAVRPLTLADAGPTFVDVAVADAPLPGTLLRLLIPGGTRVLRFVTSVDELRLPTGGRRARVWLGVTAGAPATGAEVVEAALELDDGAGRVERHEGLALGGAHPRRIAAVLCDASELVYPDASVAEADVAPLDTSLPELASGDFASVEDCYADLVPDDFFDAEWVLGDEGPAAGVHALVTVRDVSTVVVPDLYQPSPLPQLDGILDPPSLAGPRFEICAEPEGGPLQVAPVPELEGLLLDPRDPAELGRIVKYQQQLADLVESVRSFVVLLDVPPGLDQRQILTWRAQFATSYAAAYHPWLDIARSDGGGLTRRRLNPSAAAAGIIAHRELVHGVPYGPSNEIAARAVDVSDPVSPARHDVLHPAGINVFLRERDGIVLTAARTLSVDPSYRQLSVRRLMMMLIRTLERELQWVVFEPNNDSLRADLRHMLRTYLRRLYRANAFAGATEDEAFFVRCDDTVNTQLTMDAGQLVAEIGVAPAEPLEFLVVRLTQDGDGTLLVEGAQ